MICRFNTEDASGAVNMALHKVSAKATIRKDRESGAVSIFPTADFAQVLTLNAVGTFATITRFAAGAATQARF